MKKNLIYGLILLSTASFTLNSCRTDEMLTEAEQVQKEKIAFFERFEKEKSLSKNSSSNNYAIPFRNSMLAYFNNYPEKKIALESKYGTVDLRVSSQDLDLDSGKKLLMFPMLTNGKVTAVIGGVINGERDFLYFDAYKESHPDHDYLIKTFQEHYTSLSISKVTDVGEVVIIVKKPQLAKPDPWDDLGGNGGHDMGGGNGDFNDGGGGIGTGTPTAPVIPPPPPNIPIKDIKKFLNCLDISKSAKLAVYAQKILSSFPGHAFISITQGNNTMTFGFYPKYGLPSSISGTGIFGDDSGHDYTHSWNVGDISPTQLQNIIATSIAYSTSTYDIGFNNCADFTLTVLGYAGVNTNTFDVQTPDTVANLIGGLPKPGTAPVTNKTCN